MLVLSKRGLGQGRAGWEYTFYRMNVYDEWNSYYDEFFALAAAYQHLTDNWAHDLPPQQSPCVCAAKETRDIICIDIDHKTSSESTGANDGQIELQKSMLERELTWCLQPPDDVRSAPASAAEQPQLS